MPNAYSTGIATSQAGQSMPSWSQGQSSSSLYGQGGAAVNMDPSRPWEYQYQGQANTTGLAAGPSGYQGIGKYQAAANPGAYRGGFGGAGVYNGPQGQGVYSFNSPQQNDLLAKQYYAKQFRNNLPGLENQMGHNLADSANTSMQGSLDQNAQSNSSRGLLYGGINQGQQQGIRAQTAKSVAQGQSDLNTGLEGAANSMDSSAIQSGFNYQAQQQAMQNQLYKQAMASMASGGAVVGNVLGAVGAVVGGIYGGGAPGAMAGYTAGNAAGRALV